MESVTYHSDTTWPQFQEYLPEENRLTPQAMPDEYYLHTYGGWEIHVDRYRPQVFAAADAVDDGDSRASDVAPEEPAAGRALAADAEPKGRVVIFHGTGGNGRLMSFIAVPLARAGYEVVCPDLPLYGLTRYTGDILYRDWVDVGETVVQHFADDHIPLFVLGLSAGGMLAYQVADRCNRAAAEEGREAAVDGIMVTCLLDQRDDKVTRSTAANPLMGIMAKPALEGLTPELGSLPVPMMFMGNTRAVANDRNLARLLMTDAKSCGALVPLVFMKSLLEHELETEPEDFRTTPVMVAHPTRDRWTRPGLTKRFYNRLACPKMWIDLEGAGHLPVEPLGLAELETACLTFMECYR